MLIIDVEVLFEAVTRVVLDADAKAERAQECSRAVMSLLLRSPLAIMLSRASLARVGTRLSSIPQSRRLNKHLALCALEIILRLLFPELEDVRMLLAQKPNRLNSLLSVLRKSQKSSLLGSLSPI